MNYLKKDFISLYQVLTIFHKYVFIYYSIQITDSLTISKLALNINIFKEILKRF